MSFLLISTIFTLAINPRPINLLIHLGLTTVSLLFLAMDRTRQKKKVLS